jgi:glutamyl-tRNA synthetase
VNILRIEDTDRARYDEEAEIEFIEAMRWAGIEFQEGPHVGGPNGPYRQSERKEAGIYAPYVNELIEKGHAYPAFETAEELDEMREFQKFNKQPQGYFGGEWRDADPERVERAKAEGIPYVIRLKIPRNTTIQLQDSVRGRLEWDSNNLDDQVLIKKDGMPTYHFAAIVDDHLMGVTHVIRGEEWIPSAPKHAFLFEAFEWEQPIWVHCPVITGTDGKKLSKRHGATSVLDYRSMGFLPEALANFVALIGWSPGDDRECMPGQELVDAFNLRGLQPSPGRFDFEKLKWMNGHYIRSLSGEQILDKLAELAGDSGFDDFWATYELDPGQPPIVQGESKQVPAQLQALLQRAESDRAFVIRAIELEQQRVTTLADFGDACAFFFTDDPVMDSKAVEKWLRADHIEDMFQVISEGVQEGFVEADYEALLKGYQAAKGFDKLGPVVHPTRVALTGRTFGPGLWELMALLGPGRIRERLARARQ